MATADDVLADALQLPASDRHRIARELAISLDVGDGEDVSAAWGTEIESRVQDILDGKVEMIDGEDVYKRLDDRRRERRGG